MGNFFISQVSRSTPFDNEGIGYDAIDVQAAIEETRFPKWYLSSEKNIYVKEHEQYIVHRKLKLDGFIRIDGELVI